MRKVAYFVSAAILAGCGGGGDSGSNTTATTASSVTNSAPIANAGENFSTEYKDKVTLDGSKSSDPNGDTLTYNWSITSKPTNSTAILENSNTAKPTFIADQEGTYTVSLIVNDGRLASKESTVTIKTKSWVEVGAFTDKQHGHVFGLSYVPLDNTKGVIVFGGPEYAQVNGKGKFTCTTQKLHVLQVDQGGTLTNGYNLLDKDDVNIHVSEIATGDFNGDKITDFFVVDSGCDNPEIGLDGETNSLYLGTGSGFKNVSRTLPDIYAGTHSADAADIRNTGISDIIVGIPQSESKRKMSPLYASFNNGNIQTSAYAFMGPAIGPYVLRGVNGSEKLEYDTFSLPDSIAKKPQQTTTYNDPYSVYTEMKFGDIDGDGYQDLLLGGGYTQTLGKVLLNDRKGSFRTQEYIIPVSKLGADKAYVTDLKVTKINNKNILVVVYRNPLGQETVAYVQMFEFVNNKLLDVTTTYVDKDTISPGGVAAVFFMDYNNDGCDDMFLSYDTQPFDNRSYTRIYKCKNGKFSSIDAVDNTQGDNLLPFRVGNKQFLASVRARFGAQQQDPNVKYSVKIYEYR